MKNIFFNTDKLIHYDIMPYLYLELKEEYSDPKNITFEELKTFIDNKSRYKFMARCQYEVIVTGWPVQKSKYKLDVYEQIKMNLDNIAKLMFENL